MLYNANKRKTAAPMGPLDWFGASKKPRIQTAEEIRAAMLAWAAVVSRKK